MAIDDVQVSSGDCPSLGDCDFENDACGWTNSRGDDDFDWLRGRGATGSQFTGPTVDNTLGTAQGKKIALLTVGPVAYCTIMYRHNITTTQINCSLHTASQ